MPRTTSITLGEHQQHFIEMEESQGSEWLLIQLIEGKKGEAKAWDDEALMAHIKKEAKNRGNL